MPGKSKQFTEQLKSRARQIVTDCNGNVTNRSAILPLAKQLQAETGCNIETAKQHLLRIIRRASGKRELADR
jgi:hypothetical protein